MYKSFQYYTPYISLFTSYPRLQSMAPPVAPPAFFTKLTPAQFETIASVGKIVRATKYDDKNDQRVFLDEKVAILDGFSAFLAHIATEQTLYDTFYSVKNSYHQSATHSGGVIGGRYPLILDLCARLKAERERAKNAVLLAQQQHRQELEDIRALKEQKDAEAKAAKEAARLSKKDKQRTKTKRVKSKPTVEDADDEGSVFDDADYPLELAEGSGEADDPMIVDDQVTIVPSVSETVGHRSTQSLDERPLVSETLVEDINPELASQLIIQSRIAEFLKVSVLIRYASPSVKSAALTDALSPVWLQRNSTPLVVVNDSGGVILSPSMIPRISLPPLSSQLTMTKLNKLLQPLTPRSLRLPTRLLSVLSDLKNQSCEAGLLSLTLSSDTSLTIASTSSGTSSVSSTHSIGDRSPADLQRVVRVISTACYSCGIHFHGPLDCLSDPSIEELD
ncbi:hypothetical protein C8R44DRAFT_885384 [Mycena epipterygia]|nr:hypothetical protein C8R44DRAFT_885384 [Mycena epipterygia]